MKYCVVKYFDTYPDGVMGWYDTKEEAIAKKNSLDQSDNRRLATYEVRTELSSKETELLDLAKEVIGLNPDLELAVTGTLMLSMQGISVGRDAHDLDIISNKEFGAYREPQVPEGFYRCAPIYPYSVSYKHDDGRKIDFLLSTEERTTHPKYQVPVGTIAKLLSAKHFYSKQDLTPEEVLKHINDIDTIIYQLGTEDKLKMSELYQSYSEKTNSILLKKLNIYMKKVLTVFAIIIIAALVLGAAFMAFSGFIYLAWNFIIAAAFSLPTITFFQSFAVAIILEIVSLYFARKTYIAKGK